MLDLQGVELSQEDRDWLNHPLVGGVILFSRNFVDTQQLASLVQSIHALRDPMLLVAVDHEGGRVQRFREGFSLLPAAGRLGKLYDDDADRARAMTEAVGWLMAVELRAVGIDFSFAPVLDLDYDVSAVIGDRAFHRRPAVVFELGYAYMKGMQAAGMAATAKHFPGHGAVQADSHVAIPIDTRDYETIWRSDILPFRRLIDNGLAAVMPAHVIYPQVDKAPAGFSTVWLQGVLRRKLNFKGVIFSDDLDMQGASAIAEDYVERARWALHAGCDMALICNNRPAAAQILSKLDYQMNPAARMRLVRMHGRHLPDHHALQQSPRWQQVHHAVGRYLDDPNYAFKF